MTRILTMSQIAWKYIHKYMYIHLSKPKVDIYRRAGKFRGRKFHAIKFRARKFRDFVRKQAFRGFNFAICALTFPGARVSSSVQSLSAIMTSAPPRTMAVFTTPPSFRMLST